MYTRWPWGFYYGIYPLLASVIAGIDFGLIVFFIFIYTSLCIASCRLSTLRLTCLV